MYRKLNQDDLLNCHSFNPVEAFNELIWDLIYSIIFEKAKMSIWTKLCDQSDNKQPDKINKATFTVNINV